MEKKLKRSRSNKVIGGVCGGIGEYFEIDPVFVRIIVVLLALGTKGVGLMAYIIAMIIMPKDDVEFRVNEHGETVQVEDAPKEYSSLNKYLPGMVLICIGIIWLIRENFYWFRIDEFWPLILIVGGLFLIFRKKDKSKIEDITNPNMEVHDNNSDSNNGGNTV